MTRQFVAILNPRSGRRNMRGVVREIEHQLNRARASIQILETQYPGHATELASEINDSVEGLLIVGGDGTVHEIINGFQRYRPPLAVLGGGTENLLARALAMPTEPHSMARLLLNGVPRPHDVGLLNGKRFLSVAGFGFDAECVLRLTRIRRGHITRGDYFWPIWRTFWAHRFPTLVVQVDGAPVFEGPGLAVAGIIRRYAAGLQLLNRARPDDGLLDLCVLPCRSRLKLLQHAARAFRGRHVRPGGALYFQCRSARIESPDHVPCESDGDPAGQLPADLGLDGDHVKFLTLGAST